MIPLQTVVRVAPSVYRHFVQLRGVTKTTNVVSTPSTVKMSFPVCDTNTFCIHFHSRCVYALANLEQNVFTKYIACCRVIYFHDPYAI